MTNHYGNLTLLDDLPPTELRLSQDEMQLKMLDSTPRNAPEKAIESWLRQTPLTSILDFYWDIVGETDPIVPNATHYDTWSNKVASQVELYEGMSDDTTLL